MRHSAGRIEDIRPHRRQLLYSCRIIFASKFALNRTKSINDMTKGYDVCRSLQAALCIKNYLQQLFLSPHKQLNNMYQRIKSQQSPLFFSYPQPQPLSLPPPQPQSNSKSINKSFPPQNILFCSSLIRFRATILRSKARLREANLAPQSMVSSFVFYIFGIERHARNGLIDISTS